MHGAVAILLPNGGTIHSAIHILRKLKCPNQLDHLLVQLIKVET